MTQKETKVITTAALGLTAITVVTSIRSAFKIRSLRKKHEELEKTSKDVLATLSKVNDDWSSTKGQVDNSLDRITESAEKMDSFLKDFNKSKVFVVTEEANAQQPDAISESETVIQKQPDAEVIEEVEVN